jgi:hypothetical protein
MDIEKGATVFSNFNARGKKKGYQWDLNAGATPRKRGVFCVIPAATPSRFVLPSDAAHRPSCVYVHMPPCSVSTVLGWIRNRLDCSHAQLPL